MEEEVMDMISSGSGSQLTLSLWGRGPDEEWADGLGEGRNRGVFDMRLKGTLESEDGERLEAHAVGGRLCHTGMMNTYTKIGRADTHTHL